jgi:Domain of unknown function (DUF4129)
LPLSKPLAGLVRASAFAVLTVCAISTGAAPAVAPSTTVRWRDVSFDDYRKHLTELIPLVQACAKARDIKNCDPILVGPDDRVPLSSAPNGERRMIRHGWLRVLFSKAEDADQRAAKPADSKERPSDKPVIRVLQPTTSQMLQDAEKRLTADLAQLDHLAASAPDHSAERVTMQQVLAGSEFRGLVQQTVRDSMLEKLGNWLNKLFESAARLKASSAWVGRVIVWGFILAVCITLVWFLLQLERRWRLRLTPDVDRPAAGTASARDWQLWLDDARQAAAGGQWREAIHFVYWASISRLESKRLWPADRARTPREYLALVGPEDPRKPGLAQLTGSFERTWYGGRSAAEGDYRSAESLANSLISGSVPEETLSAPAMREGGAK